MNKPENETNMKYFSYKGVKSREISFPLGGIGSGCIGLGGAGHLIDWEIFNRPSKGTRNGFSHFAVKAEAKGKLLDARVLQGDMQPPYSGIGAGNYAGFGWGVARETLSGLPHFQKTEFRGSFPLAEIRFSDPAFPGEVTLAAFNPFIPLNDRDSSMPAALFTITIKNNTRQAIDYTVAFTIGNPSQAQTTNQLRQADGLHLLHLTGNADPTDVKYGDFAIASDAADVSGQEYWYRGSAGFESLGVYWQDFAVPGRLRSRNYPSPGNGDHGILAARLQVPAGGQSSTRFIFAWNVPNCHNYWSPSPACACPEVAAKPQTWLNYYATVFPSAVDCARYGLKHWDRLEQETRLFRDTLFFSTLPPAVLDAVSANISILKTPTCLRLEDGSFYGWEGCHCNSGCCEGSCTHVWNYAYALPFLFPALERSMRELDYRYNLRPDGGLAFRLLLPLGSGRSSFRPCADGQFGGVLKVYREWKISGDTAWLRRLWPQVRQSIEFAWASTNEDLWDPDKTGILQGRQHHTLDVELFGPNAWLTGFYLAALKAGAEMAEICGEPEVAEEYRAIFKRGQKWATQNLFNGEYFIQRIDFSDRELLAPYSAKDPGIQDLYWSNEHQQLKHQVGEGCGIDQVLAQWHADLMGLGDIFDRKQTQKALRAIYRHNFKPTMRNVFNPCRVYCLNDEAGTMMFSWPAGKQRPILPVNYAEETMHGFEYQAASHLIMNGMVKEGVTMVKAVRDRYDGERRNPWNEIECGSNYARSMASYALLNAFSGLQFDRVREEIGFRPAATGEVNFQCFWSVGTAWGSIAIRSSGAVLRVLYGELTLRRIALKVSHGQKGVSVVLDGHSISCKRIKDAFEFDSPITLLAGTTLQVKRKP